MDPDSSVPLPSSHISLSTDAGVHKRSTKEILATIPANVKRLVAGGLSGTFAKTVVAPVERLKIMFQVTDEKFTIRRMGNSFILVVSKEGVPGLWRGFSATVLKVFPYAGIQFTTFDYLKKLVKNSNLSIHGSPELSSRQAFFCGAFAGCFSMTVTYPLDLMRTMLAVDREKNQYSPKPSLRRAFASYWGEKGFELRGLYRGLTPTLLGIFPYAGIAFMVNEHFKKKMHQLYDEPPIYLKLMSGGFAGLLAQSASYPFEVIRRRMQTDGIIHRSKGVGGVLTGILPENSTASRLSMLQTAQEIIKDQGARALYKGLSINWIKAPVAISISFTSFDLMKELFQVK